MLITIEMFIYKYITDEYMEHHLIHYREQLL
jgi:hypothetical protein